MGDLCERELPCERCGQLCYWDDEPHPICVECAQKPTRTCADCAHYDANSAAKEGVGYCTNPNGWHKAKAMPPHEMCSKWASSHDA